MDFSQFIERHYNFPTSGVVFHDVTPLHANAPVWHQALETLTTRLAPHAFTRVVAVEAKGFILGTALAIHHNLPLSLIRKPGLTPGETVIASFEKEYGEGSYEIKPDAVGQDEAVLVAYDILAGSGASKAAFELVEKIGGRVAAAAYIVELGYLGGRETLDGYDLVSLVLVEERPEQ